MAAFWHILIPSKIAFEQKPENEQFFESEYANDYVFHSVNHYQRQSAEMHDGKHIVFDHHDLVYVLKPEVVKSEFKAFYNDFINEFYNQYAHITERQFHSPVFDNDTRLSFMKEFNHLDFHGFNPDFENQIKVLNNNFFLNNFDNLFSMIVYDGFPFPNDFTISAVSLLYSFEKMYLKAEETVAFFDFSKHFKTKYKDKYRLANYLFTAGL